MLVSLSLFSFFDKGLALTGACRFWFRRACTGKPALRANADFPFEFTIQSHCPKITAQCLSEPPMLPTLLTLCPCHVAALLKAGANGLPNCP
jgi:hypothetical protein